MPATPSQEPMTAETPQKVSDSPMVIDSPVGSVPPATVEQAPVEQESLQHEQPEVPKL